MQYMYARLFLATVGELKSMNFRKKNNIILMGLLCKIRFKKYRIYLKFKERNENFNILTYFTKSGLGAKIWRHDGEKIHFMIQ